MLRACAQRFGKRVRVVSLGVAGEEGSGEEKSKAGDSGARVMEDQRECGCQRRRWFGRENDPEFGGGHVRLELPKRLWGQMSTSQLGTWEWAREEMSVCPREVVVEAMG